MARDWLCYSEKKNNESVKWQMTDFMTAFLAKACISNVCHILPKCCGIVTTVSVLTNNSNKINYFVLHSSAAQSFWS
jgi:hypothetical protein